MERQRGEQAARDKRKRRQDKGGGIKNADKVTKHSCVLSPFYIREMKPRMGGGEMGKEKGRGGREREGGCTNANARTSKGKEIRGKCVCVCVWRQTRNSVEEICGFAFTG